MHEQNNSNNNCSLQFYDNINLAKNNNHNESKKLTKDNRKLINNGSVFKNTNNINNNRSCSTTNTVDFCEKLSDFINSPRHDCVKETTISSSATALVLSYSEDSINNNCGIASHGVGVMSQKNFMISFNQQHQNSSTSSSTTTHMLVDGSETLLSPAEAPFGRRYAEISQFKNHPNVEW